MFNLKITGALVLTALLLLMVVLYTLLYASPQNETYPRETGTSAPTETTTPSPQANVVHDSGTVVSQPISEKEAPLGSDHGMEFPTLDE